MSGHIRVANIRDGDAELDVDEIPIRIDRTNPVLGNENRMRRRQDMQERLRVIQEFERDLAADIDSNGPMSRKIQEMAERVSKGENLVLFCWCHPLPCHGDHIARSVLFRVDQMSNDERFNAPMRDRN